MNFERWGCFDIHELITMLITITLYWKNLEGREILFIVLGGITVVRNGVGTTGDSTEGF